MINNPKISIIMPVYNAEKYMNKSINSIIRQTLEDIELICINDCSTDKSLKKLQEYRKEDKRIKIINNKVNSGPGRSRNKGIKKALGKYICFLDSDDWLEKNACEILYTKAEKENADIVFIKPKFVFTDKIILDKRLLNEKDYFNKEKVLRSTLQRKIAWAPWSKLIKRKLLTENKIYFPDIYVAEDMDFSCKVIYYAKRITLEKEYLYNYYLHEGSLTSYANAERRINNYFESIDLLENFLKEKNLSEKYENDFIYFKLYNYLAIYGVLNNTKDKLNKDKYKNKIKLDKHFKILEILKLKRINQVTIGILLIKIGLFKISFKFIEFLRRLLGKWGKRNE